MPENMSKHDKNPVPTDELTEVSTSPQQEEIEAPQPGLEQESAPEKDGLPWQAYALVASREDPATWQLPHHTRKVHRTLKGKIGIEHTVDWEWMSYAVAAISRQGFEGRRAQAGEELILEAAAHLAAHYRKAGKPLPDALAALV